MSFEQRNWELFVRDMVGAVIRIQDRTEGRSFEDFAGDQDSLEIVPWNFHSRGRCRGLALPGVTERFESF